ncbi:MAG TPA: thiamine diphosphokinase [Acidimicrobiia bacterium]|jgi:thiamine pyrophosphokinase
MKVKDSVALVFAGGDPPPAPLARRLPRDGLVIGADAGVEHALTLGRHVDLAIGDFDSLKPDVLARVEQAGALVDRHPTDKDATDLELALLAACERRVERITVVGGHGGRLDHFVANVLLLAAPDLADVELDAWLGAAHVTVVRREAPINGSPGELVSLLAVGGPAFGVTTIGLRFPLHDAPLRAGSTLGVSNELVGTAGSVSVRSGVVLAVQPHALGLGGDAAS